MRKFVHDGVMYTYDDAIYLCQIDSEHLVLTHPFTFNGITIPVGFTWNGASSPNTPLLRFIAPKFYKNIIASAVHDWLCSLAQNPKERAKADKYYYLIKKYIEKDNNIRCILGLWGVRIGAFLGIGVKDDE